MDLASKRLHLSNPMCSVSGTWGIAVIALYAGFEDAAHCGGDRMQRRKNPVSLMCGIFEADFSTAYIYPHVPLTLHMGLLRCGLFEAKMAKTFICTFN